MILCTAQSQDNIAVHFSKHSGWYEDLDIHLLFLLKAHMECVSVDLMAMILHTA